MKVSEIISRIGDENLDANKIYYWESLGEYLKPKVIVKKKLRRKEYSERDFKIVQRAWYYYKKGKRAREAIEMAHRDITEKRDERLRKEISHLMQKAEARLGGMSIQRMANLVSADSDIELLEDLRKILSQILKDRENRESSENNK